MLTAKEAKEEADRTLTARVTHRVDKYLAGLDQYIRTCVSKGLYESGYAAPLDDSNEDDTIVYNQITKRLKDMGYDVPSSGLTYDQSSRCRVVGVQLRWGDASVRA